ncbi:hypothetical protein MNBD_GAMMA03-1167 [hydrothermal vent metagenome]|uniref:Flagellar FliJ protein n=1 Tax=hydrothermal vent metagenome TaxID=652676 RepID=A0A3B0WSG2_9ZZZZ
MLSRINRMQKLVELADIELDKASQTLAALLEQHEQDKNQLDSLVSYTEEYSQQSFNQSIVITPIQLQTRYCFGDKLHQAVEAQTQQVNRLDEVIEKAREEWQEKKIRKESLFALLTKLKQTHQSELNKREQRMLDELAAQKVIANRVQK